MLPIQKVLHLHLEQEKKKPKHHGHDYIITEKHDGWFGYLDLPGAIISSGKQRGIPSLRELSDVIRLHKPMCRGRLIFEILIDGLEGEFHTLNGILNRKYEQVEDVYLLVHDYLPDFRIDILAPTRMAFAREVVKRIDLPNVRMVDILDISNDESIWKAASDKVWADGGEGVILKRHNSLYSPGKRNFDLMKIKEEVTLDLLVIGLDKGSGKYYDTTGTLQVKDRAGNIHGVSGMCDAERDSWWNAPDSIIGKVVEVKAMKKLTDGTLREPRFKCIRFDKAATDID
jgi:ATP-dependent DNA ligase